MIGNGREDRRGTAGERGRLLRLPRRSRSTRSRGWSTASSTGSPARYDLMNDLMSGGLHRLWKDALVAWLAPPRRTRAATASSMSPAAPATSPSGSPTARREADRHWSPTSTPRCSPSARSGRRPRGSADRIDFVEANAEELPLPDDRFDAETIAFGIRNVPRIDRALAEAYPRAQAGRALPLPRILGRRRRRARPRSTSSSRSTSFRALGRLVAGDAEPYRYLVESIRRFPNQARFAAMIEEAGFARVELPQPLRRDRRDPFRLEALRRWRARSPRSSAWPAPASCSPARAPSRWSISTRCPPGRGWRSASARLLERARRAPRRAGAADRGAQPARAVLRQARPVPGDAARHRRPGRRRRRSAGCATRSRRFPRRRRARRSQRRSASRSTALFAVVLAAGRRRLDRPGAQGGDRRPDGDARGRSRSRCCGPAFARRFRRDLDDVLRRRAAGRAARSGSRGGCGRSRSSTRSPARSTIEMDLRLEAAALSEMAESDGRRSGLPRARRSNGS